ncbi:hypothetical protein F5Y17DRAFT_130665 [Xylariaceae sp. FL0594]|nr:hypothetical protein F5Y17DRAFT_130665 [Xylariaceae sp. FL0594]
MRSTLITAAVAAIVPAVFGQEDPGWPVGSNWTIEYWKDSNYRGDYVRRTMPIGTCADLPGGWNDAISSAKIGYGCKCLFFKNAGCHDYAPIDIILTILGPQEVPDFVTRNFNDVASSIKCLPYNSAACNTIPQPALCSNRCITY